MSLLPHFDYHRPTSLGEALGLLADLGEDARVLAGGTDLLERLRQGVVRADHLISLQEIAGLDHVRFTPDTGLVIGAAATIEDVARCAAVREHYPTLAAACDVMCTPQIRDMATVVGNVVNGSPSADTIPPLFVHDARVRLVARDGEREVPFADFFHGPGRVERRADELVREIAVPPPPAGAGTSFQRISARSTVDIAAVLVSVLVEPADGGTIAAARIVLGAVAPTPLEVPQAAAGLVGAAPTAERVAAAAELCRAAARPIEDTRASAEWRKAMVGVLARRAIEEAVVQALGGAR